MVISIIIPTYNRDNILCHTIDSVLEKSNHLIRNGEYTLEIIIVDQTKVHNSYTDNYLNRLDDFILNKNITISRIILEDANLPNARNVGIRASKGEIIIFIDDDVELEVGFIENHLNSYEFNNVVAVAGKVILKNYGGENILLRKSSAVKTALKKFLMRVLNKNKTSIITSSGLILCDFDRDKSFYTDSGRGCNMSFKRDIFNKVGFFDVNYIGNALREETDLFFRIKKEGYKSWYSHNSVLYHLMEDTGGCRSLKSKEYWKIYINNQVYFYRKNFKIPYIIIFIYLYFDLLKSKLSIGNIIHYFSISFKRSNLILKKNN